MSSQKDMGTVTVGKYGHSLTVTLPSDFVKANSIEKGDTIKYAWKGGKIVYSPPEEDEVENAFDL